MRVHLLDGTSRVVPPVLRAAPRAADDGTEIGATYGVVTSVMGMLEEGVTHLGVATDHVIRSFRNDLWPDYKTGDEVPEPCARSSGSSRTPCEPSGWWCGRWSRWRPTMRWPRPPGRRPTGASTRWSSARPTRTWPSAWWADRVVQLDRRKV